MLPTPPRINNLTWRSDGGFDRLTAQVEAALSLVIEKFAFLIKALSQNYVPVDQGAAKASHYVLFRDASGKRISTKDEAYNEASQVAKTEESRWHHKGRTLEFAPDDPEEALQLRLMALICVGVVYGMWLEHGDYNMHATNPNAQHPFLTPAILEYETAFFAACAEVFKKL